MDRFLVRKGDTENIAVSDLCTICRSSLPKRAPKSKITYGEVQLFDNPDISRIIAGWFVVLCVFLGWQPPQGPFPYNALKM